MEFCNIKLTLYLIGTGIFIVCTLSAKMKNLAKLKLVYISTFKLSKVKVC